MTQAGFKLLEHTRSELAHDGAQASSSDYAWYFDGRLTEAYSCTDIDTSLRPWVCCAAERNNVTVTVNYSSGSKDEFTVEPGKPLVWLAAQKAGETISDVTAAPVGSYALVKLMVYPSEHEYTVTDDHLLLHLDAAKGIRLGAYGSSTEVTGWKDVRVGAAEPDYFNPTGYAPTYNSSDSDFAGKPSVEIAEDDPTGYFLQDVSGTGDASTFNLLQEDPFTCLMIFYPPADIAITKLNGSTIFNNAHTGFTAPGSAFAIEGGYRPQIEVVNDSGSSAGTHEAANELIRKPTVMALVFDGSFYDLYWQGEWERLGSSIAALNSGDSYALKLFGGTISGSTGKAARGMKVADFRIYDTNIDTSIIDSYIAMAVADYGVDDTREQGNPFVSDADTFGMFRANRGVAGTTLQDDGTYTLTNWYDTRTESTASPFNPANPNGTEVVWAKDDSDFNDHDTLTLDGVSAGNGYLDYGGSTANFDFLAGSGDGGTFLIVFVRDESSQPHAPVMAMDEYPLVSAGMHIDWQNNGADGLNFEVENATGGELVKTDTEADNVTVPYSPGSVAFGVDPSNYIIEMAEVSDSVYDARELGAVSLSPSASVGQKPRIGAYYGTGSTEDMRLKGRIIEMVFVARRLTSQELQDWHVYVNRRYGGG